jgi:phosphate transport system substrate-binding protein
MTGEKWGSVNRFLFAGMVLSALLQACGGRVNTGGTDTPTRGRIRVAIDDSYRLLMDTEILTFTSTYKYAKLDTVYSNETDVIDLFKKDSVPLMVINRKLTTDEEAWLNSRQIIPKTTRIALDAVALITNNENPDSDLFYDQVKGIFTGRIATWKELDPRSGLGDIQVVFDNNKSGNPRYFREKFGIGKLPPVCYALNNNREVISFVENHKSALGVVSVNWISDQRDSVSMDFLKRVKVVGISSEGTNDPNTTFYQPYQYYIAQGFYPFIREVYMINRQTYSGLAIGFTAYVASDKGQLIVLHSGLVPSTMPVRIVEIKK